MKLRRTGTEPLTYQWLKNGEQVTGATTSIFSIASVSLDDSGEYQVRVTNPAGDKLSRSASLRVAQPVSIVAQPQSAQIRETQPYEVERPSQRIATHQLPMVQGRGESRGVQ